MASHAFLLLATAALIIGQAAAQCGAGLLPCPAVPGSCYSTTQYFCGSTQLCPVGTCVCGVACITAQYGCNSAKQVTQTPSDRSGAQCPAGTGGDPLMKGFDGCRWYLNGEADKIYNLVAAADDAVNTLLVPANLTDASHQGNGTYHGVLSFRHKDHVIEAAVSAEGNLTVTIDGKEQEFDTRFHAGAMKGKVVRHMPFFGQYLEITTPSFTYGVQAVQPATGDAGFERGHADLDITVRKGVPGLGGLLGQSYSNVQSPVCADDYRFPGEGTEADYVVPSLSSIPAPSSSTLRPARKLAEGQAGMLPVSARINC